MISYVRGTLEYIDENEVVVENGGIGYRIMVPLSVMQQLPHTGSEIRLHTYMNVREDALQLYGFLDRDDLNMFKKLITVSGIGPKGALGILSVMTPDDLRFAILSDDAKSISRAPGIGSKTAAKLVLELKDKVSLEEAFDQKSAHVAAGKTTLSNGNDGDIKGEAVQALVALGYSQSDALRGISSVEIMEDMTVEQLLKASLRKL